MDFEKSYQKLLNYQYLQGVSEDLDELLLIAA